MITTVSMAVASPPITTSPGSMTSRHDPRDYFWQYCKIFSQNRARTMSFSIPIPHMQDYGNNRRPAIHPLHQEKHLVARIGWLRAGVLGANDGIISTASLVVGVAAAAKAPGEVLVAGIAGLVAGAMAMAAGEYVSVSSQSDTENADLERERRELSTQPEAELDELTAIYVARGVAPDLARQVAEQMTAKDAFAAHSRDELGLSGHVVARPVQAALTSAVTFACGAAIPLLIAIVAPASGIALIVSLGSLICLAALGALGARIGGAAMLRPTIRVTFWGAFAMAATAAIGALVGHAV